jgi:hypothetical protein
MPKNMPASPPTSGIIETGIQIFPVEARFIAWIAKNAPRPEYTAWPKDSMPPCPSSMLYDSAKIITVPICDNSDSDAPELNRTGAMTRITAYSPQMIQRPRLTGL